MARFAKVFTFKVGQDECQVVFTIGKTEDGITQIQALTCLHGSFVPSVLRGDPGLFMSEEELNAYFSSIFEELSLDDALGFFRGVVENLHAAIPEEDLPKQNHLLFG